MKIKISRCLNLQYTISCAHLCSTNSIKLPSFIYIGSMEDDIQLIVYLILNVYNRRVVDHCFIYMKTLHPQQKKKPQIFFLQKCNGLI